MSVLSTGVAVAITFAMTFIVSVTATAIITFIVAHVCVKRLEKTTANNTTHYTNDPILQEKTYALYEEMCLPSPTVTKNDLELQPDPAYGTNHKVVIDTDHVYEIYE